MVVAIASTYGIYQCYFPYRTR